MNFTSCVYVDIRVPDKFWELHPEDFEKYILEVQCAQRVAEDAYTKALKKALKGKNYDYTVESK